MALDHGIWGLGVKVTQHGKRQYLYQRLTMVTYQLIRFAALDGGGLSRSGGTLYHSDSMNGPVSKSITPYKFPASTSFAVN